MESILQKRRRQAEHFLLMQYHRAAPGARLPSLAALCASSGIRRTLMRQALERLAREGKLRIVPRRGIYRSRMTETSRKVWLFASSAALAARSGFSRELFDTLQEEARRNGCELAPAEFTLELLLRWPQFLKRRRVRELFLWGVSHDWFREIASRNVPYVVEILPHHTPCGGSAVVDSPEMSRLQLEYLFRLGHRRIGCVHNAEMPPDTTPVQHARLADYYRIMAEHGLPVYPEWVFSGYCAPEIFRNRFQRMTAGKHPVSAIITAGCFARTLCRTARAQLLEPGRDLSILSSDEIADGTEEPVTAVTNSPAEIARSAWRLLEALRAGEPPRIAMSPLRIRTGRSVVHLEIPG